MLRRLATATFFCVGLSAAPALAQLPAAPALLADVGVSADEIAQIQAGSMVHHDVAAASDRELTTGLAFEVQAPPAKLVGEMRQDLLDRVDPNVTQKGTISNPATAADFQALTLSPEVATKYATAQPGGDLNLSKDEIAALAKLGADASTASVEAAVRSLLLARALAYQKSGLAGIAPYARESGERSAGSEIRTALMASKPLAKYAPEAYREISEYPTGKPAGAQESFRWTQFDAHGVPTIALTHVFLVPDGDAWIAVQRQFYVSAGYNAEQAVAALLPSDSGTVVVYGNRTSTDQITGFGGGAKRSLGSKVLASQLESMFERARKAAQ